MIPHAPPPPPVAVVSTACPGTAVGVFLSEWEVGTGCQKIAAGKKVRFNITNVGEDPHDFAVRTAGGRIVARAPEIGSEGTNTTKYTFKSKGTYTLVCTLSGHEELGMKSTFKVTKKRNRR